MGYTIDIDCPPGGPRPPDLLPGVLEGTGITIDPEVTVLRFFGNWTWKVPEDQEAHYAEVRKIIEKRITKLYTDGFIRYGSW